MKLFAHVLPRLLMGMFIGRSDLVGETGWFREDNLRIFIEWTRCHVV
jgi:hypothetical protein